MTNPTAAIRAVSSYVPDYVLDNETLAREFPAWTAEGIYAKTGIRERRIAAPDECASDLGVRAAQTLFNEHAIAPEDVDYLLLCTQTPDYLLPSTACLVHKRLGLRTDCASIDINQGCSGFVYGLSIAKGLIDGGIARNVLLLTADTYSKLLSGNDGGTRALFGDGAAATWIGTEQTDDPSIGPFVFGTDGGGAENLIVRSGAMRNRGTSIELFMNGPEIFNFTLTRVPRTVEKLLAAANITMDEVDHFVFHQANRFILEHLRKKMTIDSQKFVLELEKCGNTVSSSIPIALERAAAGGTFGSRARVMLVGFGVGYSWAASMLRLTLRGFQ